MKTPRISLPNGKKILPKIILSPRKHKNDFTPRFPYSYIYSSLETPPHQRSIPQKTSIKLLLQSFNSFINQFPSELLQKEMSQIVSLEKKNKGTILYRPGDEPDGWYIILNGSLLVIESTNEEPLKKSEILSFEIINNLLSLPNQKDKYFKLKEIIKNKMDFGKLDNQEIIPRNNYIYILENTNLLYFNSISYYLCLSQFNLLQLERKTNLISKTKYFSYLTYNMEICSNIAKSLKEIKLKKGFIIDENFNLEKGFLFLETGKIYRKRIINFNFINKSLLNNEVGELIIKIPNGITQIITNKLINFESFCLHKCYEKKIDFYFEIIEDSICFFLNYNDFFNIIPLEIQKKILFELYDNKTDQDVVENWLKKEIAIQWRIYRKKCVNEALDFVKTNKLNSPDEIITRIPKQPESLKFYHPK